MVLTWSIGVAAPSPSLNIDFRTFTGTRDDAITLAETFHAIEGRRTIVVLGTNGYAKAPTWKSAA